MVFNELLTLKAFYVGGKVTDRHTGWFNFNWLCVIVIVIVRVGVTVLFFYCWSLFCSDLNLWGGIESTHQHELLATSNKLHVGFSKLDVGLAMVIISSVNENMVELTVGCLAEIPASGFLFTFLPYLMGSSWPITHVSTKFPWYPSGICIIFLAGKHSKRHTFVTVDTFTKTSASQLF